MEPIKMTISKEQLDNNAGGGGLEIRVPGFNGNPACPAEGQIFIEVYDGKLRVHAWNDTQDPETIEINPFEKPAENCSTCKHENEPDTHPNCQKCIAGGDPDGYEPKVDNGE